MRDDEGKDCISLSEQSPRGCWELTGPTESKQRKTMKPVTLCASLGNVTKVVDLLSLVEDFLLCVFIVFVSPIAADPTPDVIFLHPDVSETHSFSLQTFTKVSVIR